MKNEKRAYNATRDTWVKIICKDEPKPKAMLEDLFGKLVKEPYQAREPGKGQDRSR